MIEKQLQKKAFTLGLKKKQKGTKEDKETVIELLLDLTKDGRNHTFIDFP